MKYNGLHNVITEDDITLTNYEGLSLSDVLTKHQKNISDLASNVKWLYKYGGIGSGGGPGGSSGIEFSISATLNNYSIESGKTIVLDKPGDYELHVSINNPGGSLYNVQCLYTKGEDKKPQNLTRTLTLDNNYELNSTISLDNNDAIFIKVMSADGTKKLLESNYVTLPYVFNYKLTNTKGDNLIDEIFINTANRDGIKSILDYSILVEAEVSYVYEFNGTKTEGTITDKTGRLEFEIDKSLFTESNAGTYSTKITLFILAVNQKPIKEEYILNFSLVPDDLYILVNPKSGIFYKQPEVANPFKFNEGSVDIILRVYQGQNENRSYTVNYNINSEPLLTLYVTEREPKTISVNSHLEGLNTFNIKVAFESSVYKVTYYFFILKNLAYIDWYNESLKGNFNYFRLKDCSEVFKDFNTLLNGYIRQTLNGEIIRLPHINKLDLPGDAVFNTHIALGIQSNTINTNLEYLEFFNDGLSIVKIYKDKINIDTTKCYYTLPEVENYNINTAENYHLLEIYSNYTKTINNQAYYSLNIYVDGVLESSSEKLQNKPLQVTDFNFNPCNCILNLFEFSYITNIKENPIPQDMVAYQYYLNYLSSILGIEVNKEISIFNNFNEFKPLLNGDVICGNINAIQNIAANLECPTMMMTILDDDYKVLLELKTGYDEESGTLLYDVALKWSPGMTKMVNVNMPTDVNTLQFKIQIQGSSTKSYKLKNFQLILDNADTSETARTYLFSPNFKNGDSETFLPELEFTLKADVVDSSHCNNTSVGKFVNKICKKFSDSIGDNSVYKGYIKNCLDGFPILLYLELVHDKKDGSTPTSEYYYFGIYNFNLGRTSYYNLGYKDLKVFCDVSNKGLIQDTKGSFTFYDVNPDDNIFKKDLVIAEVQGNNPYFDFSQWDPSILFKGSYENDRLYMFGDLVFGDSAGYDTCISNFVKNIALSGGYLFNYIKKSFGPYKEAYHGADEKGISKNQVPDYTTLYERQFKDNTMLYIPILKIPLSDVINDKYLREAITYDEESGRLPILDFRSLSEYYTICMAFGLVDSVLKNLNIKTWNRKTFYTAFYDMDTCLGVDNAGRDTSYFCFSDYWDQEENIYGDTVIPKSIKVYRDFYPETFGLEESGFDTPSSYLFAIAKYARLISKFNDFTIDFPQTLWARWRSGNIDEKSGMGCLLNADTFIKNFFTKNSINIPKILTSYNYRTKYFIIENDYDDAYNNTNYIKFKGTRIEKVRKWLNGRFHLMDAYFNLHKALDSIQYRNEEGKFVDATINGSTIIAPSPDPTINLVNNEDIIILHDIFSDPKAPRLASGTLRFKVQTDIPNSPLIINVTNTQYNYLLGNNKYYDISASISGNLFITLGGSSAWTYLENINLAGFIGNLYVNSKKLTRLVGNSGKLTSYNITMPALELLQLNSKNYSGSLIINNNTSDFSNLNVVDISNSNIGLDLNGILCTEINLTNNTASQTKLISCTKLKNIVLNNTNIDQFVVTPTPTIPVFIVNDLGMLILDLTSPKTARDTNNYAVQIANNKKLTSLFLKGYDEIVIVNCPNLLTISITDDSKNLKKLIINNCKDANLTVNKNGKILDLRTFTSLQEVNFKETNFSIIKFPETETPVKLTNSCFYNMPNLINVDGKNLVISGESVFRNCEHYTMRLTSGAYTDLRVPETLTSLAYTFEGNKTLTYADAKHFIEDIIPINNRILSISSIFSANSNIIYTLEDLQNDLQFGGTKCMSLQHLKYLSNASYAFYSTKIMGNNPKMFNFGENISSINIMGFTNVSLMYVPIDLYKYIMPKITGLNSGGYWDGVHMVILDSLGNELESFNLYDFLHPIKDGVVQNPINITKLEHFNFNNKLAIDFTNAFKDMPKLQEISHSFLGLSEKATNLNRLLIDKKLKVFSSSFSGTILESEAIDLYHFLNWNYLIDNLNVGGIVHKYIDATFTISKFISKEDFNALWTKILKSRNIKYLNFIFYNCTLISPDGKLEIPNILNDLIINLDYLFTNFKIKLDFYGANIPIEVDEHLFDALPKIQSLEGTFSGIKFKNCLPYNFFGKRRKSVNNNIFVLNRDGSYKLALLITYSYERDLVNLAYCFQKTEWIKPYFDPSTVNTLDKNKILVDGVISDETTYYILKSIPGSMEVKYVRYDLEIPDDMEDVTNPEFLGKGHYSKIADVVINHNVPAEAVNYLFVAPDIFYGCDTSCSLSQCFNNMESKSPMCGMIPQHLLKNCRNSALESIFAGNNILPRFLKTVREGKNEYNIYYYIPRNFTDLVILDSAFNFNLNLPNSILTPEKNTYYCYNVLLEDSLNLIASIKSAFPNKVGPGLDNHNGYLNKYNIHYNLMYNSVTDSLGFDMSTHPSLMLENFVGTLLGIYLYGNLFADGFYTNDIITNDKQIKDPVSGALVYVQGSLMSMPYYGLSSNCILPPARAKFNPNLFVWGNHGEKLKRELINNNDSASIDYYTKTFPKLKVE